MLTPSETTLLLIIGGALVAILSGRIRPDLVALCVLLALSIVGLVTPQEAISGFSRSAVITIIGLFVISQGLEDTGVVNWLADRLRHIGNSSETRLIVLFMAGGALLSLVMNNIAAGAVLLPAAVQVCRDSGIRPSRVLMPLSFGTLVGGMATYFTTANIVISGVLIDQGQRGLGMLDFIPTGGLIVLVSLAFMALFGRRLLPIRDSAGGTIGSSAFSLSRRLYETYQLEERLWELVVKPDSRLIGCTLRDSRIGSELGLSILAIWRRHRAILTPKPEEVVEAGDFLLVLGREERVQLLLAWGLAFGRVEDPHHPQHDYAVDLTEAVILPRSSAVGKTLTELRFRNKYGLTAVALWREGRSYRTDVGKFTLQVGDAILMVGSGERIRLLGQDRDFLVLQSSHAARPPFPNKAWIALAITALVLLASIVGWLPTPEAMLAGAAALALTGCLNLDEAYRQIEWRVVFLIAGMMPISLAMVNTGLAERIGGLIVEAFAPFGALALIGGLFIVTMLVTQIVAGQVSAVILAPVAVNAALQVGANPQAVAVAVAIACSTAFLLPTAHPVNVLMMGPAGYKPNDFWRVGIFMTLIAFVMTLIGMAVFWGISA